MRITGKRRGKKIVRNESEGCTVSSSGGVVGSGKHVMHSEGVGKILDALNARLASCHPPFNYFPYTSITLRCYRFHVFLSLFLPPHPLLSLLLLLFLNVYIMRICSSQGIAACLLNYESSFFFFLFATTHVHLTNKWRSEQLDSKANIVLMVQFVLEWESAVVVYKHVSFVCMYLSLSLSFVCMWR
uniref:Uncharacterized protein n=1 Tax=Trypanosoma vivax (strain Y486) TaxID=1055687 RepID=G0TR84_TRYVY|nr:conserved hypothetical protein, in T. vivax [Trypanosoma vivax Y486]